MCVFMRRGGHDEVSCLVRFERLLFVDVENGGWLRMELGWLSLAEKRSGWGWGRNERCVTVSQERVRDQ